MDARFTRGFFIGGLVACVLLAAGPVAAESPYAQWSRGPSTDPSYFPIGVWAQAPRSDRVAAYSAAGFNLYVGISWDETEAGMDRLRNAGMRILLHQDEFALAHLDDPVIAGWLQQDEPDNAQANPYGGYYSPVPPFDDTWWNTNPASTLSIYRRYTNMKIVDDTRPVYLNLGQGVAWDEWVGRGIRTNHPEDYPEYVQGTDIVSFDIYPGASSRTETAGKLWLVAEGVDRLVDAAAPGQPVWNCIECTNISGAGMATPAEVKAEVWMSIIHGSMGLVYFAHVIGPDFDEMGLLHDPVMLAAVTEINWEVRSLAPALNSPTIEGEMHVSSSSPVVPIDSILKRVDGVTYLFCVAMRGGTTTGTFYDTNLPPAAMVEAIGEDREFPVYGGYFTDTFTPFGVHLYRITSRMPGDADGNGRVDIDDFVILKNNFGTGTTWNEGDFNGDGAVTIDDFVILKNAFGQVYVN